MSSGPVPPSAMGVLTHCGSPSDDCGSPAGVGRLSPARGSAFSSATIARTRPKLPHLGERSSTLSPERPSSRSDPPRTKGHLENLEAAFTDLGNIDFVSKYIRKRRPSGTGSPSPSHSSLPMSPMSPLTSPGTRTPKHGEVPSGATVTRIHSLNLKLVELKKSQDRAEKAGEGLRNSVRRRPAVVGTQSGQHGVRKTGKTPSSSQDERVDKSKGTKLLGRDSSEEKIFDPHLGSPPPPLGSVPATPMQGNGGLPFQRAWSEPSYLVASKHRMHDEPVGEDTSHPDTPPLTNSSHLWQQHGWSAVSDRLKDGHVHLPASGSSTSLTQQPSPCDMSGENLPLSESFDQSQDESSMSDDLLSKCSSTSTLKGAVGSDEECFSRTGSLKKILAGPTNRVIESIDPDLINVIPEIEKTYGASRKVEDLKEGSSCSVESYSEVCEPLQTQAPGQKTRDLDTEKERSRRRSGEETKTNKCCSSDGAAAGRVGSLEEGVDEGVGGESGEDETYSRPVSARNQLLPREAPLCRSTEEEEEDEEEVEEVDGHSGSAEGMSGRRKGMFLTHPPVGERKTSKEANTHSVDSNGLSSLRRASDSVPEAGKLASQVSTSSLDSHMCGEEGSATYQDIVLHVMAEGNDLDKQERKNGKALKQKSKSDPSGEKQKSKEGQETGNLQSAQSSPLLPEEKQTSALRHLTEQAKLPVKAKSEDLLSVRKGRFLPQYEHVVDEDGTKMSSEESQDDQPPRKAGPAAKPNAKQRGRAFRVKKKTDQGTAKRGEQDLGGHQIHEPVLDSEPSSSPSTPRTQSPENTLYHATVKPHGVNFAKTRHTSHVERSRSFAGHTQEARSRRLPDICGPAGRIGSPYSPKLEPILTFGSNLSLMETPASEKEKRDMIVEELVSTEQQYVHTLHMLVEKYMIPLKKAASVIDSHLVDDIFYKINEIYMHHAMFLAFLEPTLQKWDNANSTIGDVIKQTFSRDTVIENYTCFIENFPKAEKALQDLSSKGPFMKFIEQAERETGNKLPLKAQIVKPAQRIPRYELLLRRLIENTPKDHPDYELLLGAEEAIHKVALKINTVKNSKHEEDLQETLRKLEFLLVTVLIAPERIYHRYDMVQILNRKEQCSIWLFSDLAVFTSIKRKSGPVSRKTLLLQSPLGQDFVENVKHKVWLKIPLDDLDIIKGAALGTQKASVDHEELEEDFTFLTKVADLTAKLHTPHQNLDDAVHELMSQINKQLSEHQRRSPPPDSCKVELMATTTEGVSNITVVFPSPEKKSSWETAFWDIKQKLATLSNCRPPEFLQALQITKTRAGMQFSCAAAIEGVKASQQRDVWVCNSDGYVGHMCLLSLQPEPIVTLNTPVPGCNSRILCICAVPAFHAPKRSRCSSRVSKSAGSPTSPVTIRIEPLDSGETDEEEEEEEEEDGEEEEEEEDEDSMSDLSTSLSDPGYSEGEDSHCGQPQVKDGARASPMPPSGESGSKDKPPQDITQKGTMWLGTEDGCIHIFLCTDNIKTTKNKLKVQQNAGILGMVQIDQKVFVSLANGELVIYQRNKDGLWDMNNPETLALGSANSPITKMLPVAGKLWCACQGNIIILNTSTFAHEYEFAVNLDSRRCIQCLAVSGQGVWLSGQNSSKVLLYHATTYEHLLEVSIAQAVAQKLQTADDIIRQHKTACLRITSLLACKDLLWVGTSAGVVLTLVMPKVSASTTRLSLSQPAVTGLVHGHTGHVRFLTSVEMASPSGSSENLNSSSALSRQAVRRASVSLHMLTLATKMLVISGGDGYEDFRNASSNEAAGRDDSTNHLLLWQV